MIKQQQQHIPLLILQIEIYDAPGSSFNIAMTEEEVGFKPREPSSGNKRST